MDNMENVNILITGASGGIGTSLSKTFASTKANLFLVGSSEEKISKLRNELPTRENINYPAPLIFYHPSNKLSADNHRCIDINCKNLIPRVFRHSHK